MARLFTALFITALLSVTGGQRLIAQDTLTRSTLSAEQRLLGLAHLWREARDGFAYFRMTSAEWDSLFHAYIPRVQAATTDYSYFLEVMRFYAHLRDGHSGVFWPNEFDEALGYPPFEIRKIGNRAVIFRILKDSEEMARYGIRPGLVILSVDERPVAEVIHYWRELKQGSTEQATDRLAYFRILTGPRNSRASVVLQAPGGAPRTVQLTRSEKYFNDTNLDPTLSHVERTLERDTSFFQANQMRAEVSEAFGRFIENAVDMKRLILDLRYNGGGSDVAAHDMVRRLIDEPIDGPIYEATSYRPDRRALRLDQEVVRTQGRILPATGRRFSGQLVVLIGEQSHSATESGFLAVIKQRPRTIFVGEPTAGSTGQALVFRLPGNALGAVCSRRGLAHDGSPFVGVGFQPDIYAYSTPEDVFRGRDRVIEVALQNLK